MNADDGKAWNYDGMQLRSNLPPLADRDALYEQMGAGHYTKFYKLPTDVKNFDKFTMKFNETHWYNSEHDYLLNKKTMKIQKP